MHGDRNASPEYEIRTSAHACALSLPDNDVFTRSSLQTQKPAPGKPFNSQCHRSTAPAGGPRRRKPVIPRSRDAWSWWSQTGSNRRPHACKARALPTELWPLKSLARWEPSSTCLSAQGVTHCPVMGSVVGPGRLELPTSRLSGVCSNHLSYRPLKRPAASVLPGGGRARRMRDRTTAS